MIIFNSNILLGILTLLSHCNTTPQIFETEESCEFIKKGSDGKDSIYLKRGTWQVEATGKALANKKFLISPCNLITAVQGCKPGVSACILNTKNPKESILNAGEYFEHERDTENDKDILRSFNGQKCSSTENFTIIIELNCVPNVKETPKLLYQDECELRVEMLHPTCTPECTTREDGYLIDLRGLKKLGSQIVQDPVSRTFVLGFCRHPEECGTSEILMCERTNDVLPIADIKTESISYHESKQGNSLVLKAHHGTGKKRKNTEIHLKCKWDEEKISKLRYIPAKPEGKIFRFEGYSSFACIKTPMSIKCRVVDQDNPYLVYDLKGLNSPNGAWKVTNTTASEMIYINMCAPLKIPQPTQNICTAQSSQVCSKNSKGEYFNLGSIASNFHVTGDDTVKAYFKDGSTCLINASLTYSTEIEFVCAVQEYGPILHLKDNCTYIINWKTPAACPKNIAHEDNCLMSDTTGNIDLSSIHKPLDSVHQLSANSYIRYNLCGASKTLCNKKNDTSICYVKNGKESIIGYASKVLERYNTLLSLNLIGDRCGNASTRSITKVHFSCDYHAPHDGNVRVKMIQDDCIFEIHVDTPLACVRPSIIGCRLFIENSMYDLTPLVHNESNYVVRDMKDPNVLYVLNICRSVVPTKDLFCSETSAVCVRNLTEPHIKHTYTSVGNIQEKTALRLENNNVILHYSGDFCSSEKNSYSTRIQFECSSREESLQLLNKSPCSYNFLWRTPYACPKNIVTVVRRFASTSCIYVNPVASNKEFDFSSLNQDIKVPVSDLEYIINICETNYSHSLKNGTTHNSFYSKTTLLYDNNELYFQLTLAAVCEKDIQPNIIRIQLICDYTKTTGEIGSFMITDCTVSFSIKSKISCLNEIELKTTSQNVPTTIKNALTKAYTTTATNYPASVTPHRLKIFDLKSVVESSKCVVEHANGTFNLKSMNFQVMSNSANKYSVIFGSETSSCAGYICMNGTEYLHRTDECPTAVYSETSQVIKLSFSSHLSCGDAMYSLEIWLKCDTTIEELPTVEESPCNIVLMYPTKGVCSLLRDSNTLYQSSSTGTAISISIGITMFLMAVCIVGTVKKCLPCLKISSKLRSNYQRIVDKQSTPIYYKDLSV